MITYLYLTLRLWLLLGAWFISWYGQLRPAGVSLALWWSL
jgi:hypothetical protein